MVFDYSDQELLQKGGYDLIHPDDLNYFAAAHQERKHVLAVMIFNIVLFVIRITNDGVEVFNSVHH